ncbi:MAG TPA: phage major tail tube protein [Sporosarcina psychrophila]|uniref:Phage major tail tube protein n=1 Tax=Sporosarcina psychrophila TaxID=1476 RepID=A0A921KFG4_SPOPS|nr:phage major tail tube protein [Sporosarcina psychrophila]
MSTIPEKIVNFNVYSDADKLVGVAAEVTLPDFEAMTETVSGAGIAGEYESATPGHFSSQTIEIPFRSISDPSFKFLQNKGQTIILRAAQQSYDVSSGKTNIRPLKVTIKGLPKGLNLGKVGVGTPTETTNTIEILYIKIEENGVTLLELDKLNFIFIVNGKDLLEDVRNAI